jgi:hypothetical protein
MFLPKDSFCARILNRNTLGWLNFAYRTAACKQRPDQPCGQQRYGNLAPGNMAIRQPIPAF